MACTWMIKIFSIYLSVIVFLKSKSEAESIQRKLMHGKVSVQKYFKILTMFTQLKDVVKIPVWREETLATLASI